jgi:iron complex transport system permease protein
MKAWEQLRTIPGRLMVLGAMGILLVVSMLLSLRFGSVALSQSEILKALFFGSEDIAGPIIRSIRLPRILLGAMVGAALAVSGAVLQGVMRNPLAAPGLIGVSSGGGLAGIVVLLALPQFAHLLVPAAFVGSLATALLVYGLAWKRGASPVRLVLAGVAVAAMLGAFSSAILLFNAEKAGSILDFTIGSLSARGWDQIEMVWAYLAGGLAAALLLSNKLNILALGDEVATGLGLRVERTRFLLIATAALLAAAAVSVAGLLGFVGLIAPHIVRILIGTDNRFLVPGSALFGAFMVVSCDTLGRLVMPPAELPVGIIMALLGPPFFLWLLRRNRYEA